MANVKEMTVFKSVERSNGKSFVSFTEKETGEIVGEFWQQTKSGKAGNVVPGNGIRFFKVYTTNWRDIVLKKRLDLVESGLFFQILAFIDWESPYLVHPETRKLLSGSMIAKLLGHDRKHVESILIRLVKKGMIAKVHCGTGNACSYMLNSNIVHFGKYMRDIKDHMNFDKCGYEPPKTVHYKEPPPK